MEFCTEWGMGEVASDAMVNVQTVESGLMISKTVERGLGWCDGSSALLVLCV